jgi:copper chaperone CopZ
MCKNRIENALKIKGITYASWDVDSKILSLVFDNKIVSMDKIETKILNAGHDLEGKKAKDIIYNQLPNCCHYREASTMDDHTPNNEVKGVVLHEQYNGKFEPLVNASVFWLGTKKGVVSDAMGVFAIAPNDKTNRLVVSYVGYTADTLTILDNKELKVILGSNNKLTQVTVFSRPTGSFVPYLSTVRTQVMTSTELLKAACCNLSESFETNPSVDVSFNDAITGSKQIQLLGLSGNYTQLTVENLPGPRGLATPLGLNSIAGPWIESIQLTKGIGSVANGFESIAGQINVELKKPESAEKLYANAYVNEFGKTDLNLNLTQKLSNKWSSALLLHDDFLHNNQVDMNGDGFLDLPNGNQLSIVNRYKYDDSKGVLAQMGIKYFNDDRTGGQLGFTPSMRGMLNGLYGLGIKNERVEVFGKLGYVFPQEKYKSLGLQVTSIQFNNASYFGLNQYDAKQHSDYINFIYQSIFSSTIHKYRTGLSVANDQYNEVFNLNQYKRTEITPGAFFEYTYTPNEKFSSVMGVRADNNNLFGAFVTPRLNVRYEIAKGTVIRLSAGRGQRTANIFAENNSVFVSSRSLNILATNTAGAYGLTPEIAWNKGISLDQKFTLFKNNASLSLDFFRNDFTNQVVVDVENPRTVSFYNSKGPSYSNSFQSELTIEPIKKLDVKMAYRFFDVKETIGGKLLDRALIAKHRAFVSVDYATANYWKFNYTISWNGKKRIPKTSANPAIYQLADYSPSFVLMNAQISKTFGKTRPTDVYVGVENLGNYVQMNPILASTQPYSNYFDASMVWGPITGRMFYIGWRYKIK